MPSSRGTQLLTSVFKSGDPDAIWPPVEAHASIEPIPPPVRIAVAKSPSSSKRRTQIWDLHHSLHCSIIGTCLTTAELRRVLVRLQVSGVETADEHELHMLGVLLASRPKAGAIQLQKALDRAHRLALGQFASTSSQRF